MVALAAFRPAVARGGLREIMPGQSPAILWVLLLAGLLGVWPAAGCKGEASLPAAGPAGSPTQSMATPGPTPTPTTPSHRQRQRHQPAPTATPTLNQLAAGFRYSAVSAGYQTCLLRTDGVAVCWGGGSSLPRGRYSAISVGAYACGVREDGEARCWGDRRYNNHYGQMDAPDGKFQSVSVGVEHACGIRTDGRVECWGRNTDSLGNVLGQSDPPDGVFRSVSAGDQYTCGIRHDHAALCWGENYRGRSMPPDADFQSVSAGTFHACGLRTDGTAACWGANREGQATPPSGVFSAISAGEEHTCALRPDGSALCWGWNGHGQATPPEGAFAAIAAGRWHTCALRPDGSPRCWGYDESGTATPPGLPVDLGYTCGAGAEGGLECRRDDPYEHSAYDPSAAPAGDFTAVSATPYRVCALRSGGTVVCLKPDHPSRIPELALPGSGYVAVSAAAAYVCGLRGDQQAAVRLCPRYGKRRPDSGKFPGGQRGRILCLRGDDQGRRPLLAPYRARSVHPRAYPADNAAVLRRLYRGERGTVARLRGAQRRAGSVLGRQLRVL